MKQAILDFPEQFKTGLEAAQEVGNSQATSNIIICGMGGSALPANLLITYLKTRRKKLLAEGKHNFPAIYISRNYNLPPQVGQDSLVICISYSGDTEETLSCYRQALDQDLFPLAITTGGQLQQLAQENDLPVAKIPSGIQPRQAIGYQFSALLQILHNCGIVAEQKNNLLALEDILQPQQLQEQGKKLSEELTNKLPLIYAPEKFKALARIWKIKFNENAKSMAYWNYFPELNHNEMTGFEQAAKQVDPEQLRVLMLKEEGNSRMNKRMQLTKQLLQEHNIKTKEIALEGGTLLEKIFNSVLLSDWTTFYLAKQYGIDPEAVPIIEEFKKQL